MTPMLRVLSLGAGVQSTTLALMAARRDVEPPDCAIFADTGWEPAAVYKHLDWLETQLPFPVYRVSGGNIRADIVAKNTKSMGRFAAVPWFLKNADGTKGMGRRQCTSHYKIEPIRRQIRFLLGAGERGFVRPGAVEMWIGISTDEIQRMRPSKRRFIVNTHPLIGLDMSRRACLQWMADRQYPRPPKSACIGCPFHSDAGWLALEPAELVDAIFIDELIREAGTMRGINGTQFMHASLLPLSQVDFTRWQDRGQPDLFGNECEGMCGV